MKQTHSFISTLFIVTVLFHANGFAQDYVHYKTLKGHAEAVVSIAFSPDGKTLASGSFDNTIRLWDMSTGTHKRTLTGHTEGVSSISFSPDGQILASGSLDRTIRLWDVGIGQHKKTFIGPNLIWSVSFNPDGQILASGSLYNTISLWDAVTGQHKKTLIGHIGGVSSVTFSPDGQMLASGSDDKTIRLWKLTSPRPAKLDFTPPKPTANQIYNNAIRSVMWIVNPGIGEGSGVLLDKKSKLAVTNAHVTGKQKHIRNTPKDMSSLKMRKRIWQSSDLTDYPILPAKLTGISRHPHQKQVNWSISSATLQNKSCGVGLLVNS